RRDCTTSLNGRLVLRSRPSDGICIYLDGEKRCSVYEDRPQQCAAFPWWSENLRSMRAWRKIRRTCPGIDAPDALRVEGDVIRLHVARDLESGRGVRLPLPPNEP
ncbi:MAG TPA: YkgJ family cysteine cluster protein, partial [Candidatus Poseidoniaceae archaeon]